MSKKSPTRKELTKEIMAKMLDGKGIQKRVAADAAKPIISSRIDGIRFDPAMQDAWIDLWIKKAPDSKQS